MKFYIVIAVMVLLTAPSGYALNDTQSKNDLEALTLKVDRKDIPKHLLVKSKKIKRKPKYEDLYEESHFEKLIIETLDNFILDIAKTAKDKTIINQMIRSTQFGKLPYLFGDEVKKNFTKEEIKQVRNYLRKPFVQKAFKVLLKAESDYRKQKVNIINLRKDAMVNPRKDLTSTLNQTILDARITYGIKMYLTKGLTVYRNLMVDGSKKTSRAQIKRRFQGFNFRAAKSFTDKQYYIVFSRLKVSELTELKRIFQTPVMRKFFFTRMQVAFKLLQTAPANFVKNLYASLGKEKKKKGQERFKRSLF